MNIKKPKYLITNRDTLKPYTPGQILAQFYSSIVKKTKEIALPHRNAYYAWVILRDDDNLTSILGRQVSLQEVEVAMYHEGMLPASEYGIPSWFRVKYGMR